MTSDTSLSNGVRLGQRVNIRKIHSSEMNYSVALLPTRFPSCSQQYDSGWREGRLPKLGQVSASPSIAVKSGSQ